MACVIRTITTARVLGVVFWLGLGVSAGAGQNDDIEWVTIGDPGNRPTQPHEVPREPDLEIGAVAYEYRMTRTEVTVEQHFQFLQAFWPHSDRADRLFPAVTGPWIRSATNDPDDPQYYIVEGAERRPTGMDWRTGARMANWLHNGKGGDAGSFATGAYDTSTFGFDDDGRFTDQATRSPGARFWIPSVDELTKALFWDPTEQGRYWRYPHGSDASPVSGWPWDGGETNAGVPYGHDDPGWLDAGSYPWATSPWGLLDGSGGVDEWSEGVGWGGWDRLVHGSNQFDDSYARTDRIDYWNASGPYFFPHGLRLAAQVPAPSGLVTVLVILAWVPRRDRSSRCLRE